MKKAKYFYLLRRGFFGGGGSQGSTYIRITSEAGYSGGSVQCADETFNALQAIPALGFAVADEYITVTTADGYSGGNLFCAEQSFQSLIDIA